MPDQEVARCIVCGKVQLVDWEKDLTAHMVDLGEGIVVVGIHPDDDDPPLYWPDGMAVAACPTHSQDAALSAFDLYPPSHWIEGKPSGNN